MPRALPPVGPLSPVPKEPRRGPGGRWAPRAQWEAPRDQAPGGLGSLAAAGTADGGFSPGTGHPLCAQGADGEEGAGPWGEGGSAPAAPADRAEPGRPALGTPPARPAALPGLLLACLQPALPAEGLGHPSLQPGQPPPGTLMPPSPSCLSLPGEPPAGPWSPLGEQRSRGREDAHMQMFRGCREAGGCAGLEGAGPDPGSEMSSPCALSSEDAAWVDIRHDRRVTSGGLPGGGAAWKGWSRGRVDG